MTADKPTEPTTEAGRALLDVLAPHRTDSQYADAEVNREFQAARILDIEAQARQQSERDVLALREALDSIHLIAHGDRPHKCVWLDVLFDSAPTAQAIEDGIRADERAKGGLTFAHFSEVNRDRCESPDGFGHPVKGWTLSDWFTAAVGEFGEAANKAKKLNRYRDGIPGNTETEAELRAGLADEIADTAIYLDLLSQAAGVDLGAAIVSKFNRTSEKIGAPHRLPRALSTPDPSPVAHPDAGKECCGVEPKHTVEQHYDAMRPAPEEKAMGIQKPNICGVLIAGGPNGEPLACGFPPSPADKPMHRHSWADLPTYVKGVPVLTMADRVALDDVSNLVSKARDLSEWWRHGGRVEGATDAVNPVMAAVARLSVSKP